MSDSWMCVRHHLLGEHTKGQLLVLQLLVRRLDSTGDVMIIGTHSLLWNQDANDIDLFLKNNFTA